MSDNSHLPNVRTFSVLDAIQGTAYPADDITVYTNVEALYEIQRLESEAADELDAALVDDIQAEIETQRNLILQSALTFSLRGIPPRVKDRNLDKTRAKFELRDEDAILPGSAAYDWLMSAHLAEMIQKVTSADGSEDNHHWTAEEVIDLHGLLSPAESGRLDAKGSELSFQAFAFDQAVTPDFS